MLRSKLQDEQLQALKSGDRVRLDTLRFILSHVKNKEIEKKDELNDEETVAVIKKIHRELQESIDAAEKAGRTELAEQSKKQMEIIAPYIPAEMNDEDLKKEIEKIIAANKELYEKSPKAIIGLCMKELRSKADGTRIMAILNSR